MTAEGHTKLMIVLDNIWGGVDEGREEGYRWVLDEFPDDIVERAVREMSLEDRTWLPKAPEIAARAGRIAREQRTHGRLRGLLAGLPRQLTQGGA